VIREKTRRRQQQENQGQEEGGGFLDNILDTLKGKGGGGLF